MAGTVNFRGRQGSRFRRTITVASAGDPIDLTGYGVRMQVREEIDSTEPLLSLALGEGIELAADPTTGIFTIDVGATDMADLDVSSFQGYHFDLELVPAADDDQAFALLGGRFIVEPEVTR